jgi:excisionase family DNA binding protein
MDKKELLSTAEVAKILGISRVAVFNKIKNGDIKAEKIGRNFVIRKSDISDMLVGVLSKDKKKKIDKAIARTINEYGETLRLLGKE